MASLGLNPVGPGLWILMEVLLSWENDRAELLNRKKIFCKCIIKSSQAAALVLALCILAVGEHHLVRHWFRVHTNPRRHHNVKMCPQAISITLFPFGHDCMLLDDNRITLVTLVGTGLSPHFPHWGPWVEA